MATEGSRRTRVSSQVCFIFIIPLTINRSYAYAPTPIPPLSTSPPPSSTIMAQRLPRLGLRYFAGSATCPVFVPFSTRSLCCMSC